MLDIKVNSILGKLYYKIYIPISIYQRFHIRKLNKPLKVLIHNSEDFNSVSAIGIYYIG